MVHLFFLYSEGVETPSEDEIEGNGPIHIHNVSCVGSETEITGCNFLYNTNITSHQQDVGVQCQQGQCKCMSIQITYIARYGSILHNIVIDIWFVYSPHTLGNSLLAFGFKSTIVHVLFLLLLVELT